MSSRVYIGPAIIPPHPEDPEDLGEPGIEMALGDCAFSGVSSLENFVAFVHYHTEEFKLSNYAIAAMQLYVQQHGAFQMGGHSGGASAPQPTRRSQ